MDELSCSCDSDYAFYVSDDSDYSLCDKKQKCDSCGSVIEIGDTRLFFNTYEHDEDGEEIDTDYCNPFSYCEDCADIYFNLTELNYCITYPASMKDLLRQYQLIVGFEKGD